MNRMPTTRAWVLAALATSLALGGCVAGAGYDDGAVGVSYSADFYEPFGYDYGGWGPGYRVGPPNRGYSRPEPRAGRAPQAYRSAPASRPMPSIPNRSR
jgi:hypothetical protein